MVQNIILTLSAASGLPPNVNQEVCLWEYFQGGYSKAVSLWSSAWIAKTVDTFVAEVSARVARRCDERSGKLFYCILCECELNWVL